MLPTKNEYEDFGKKNIVESCTVVVEDPESMQNAYFMINPQGEVYMNDNGSEKKYGSCFEKSLVEIFQTVPLDQEKYFAKYSEECHNNYGAYMA